MDQSFNRATLARCLIAKDFFLDENLNDDAYRREVVDKAVSFSQASNTFTPNILESNSSKKPMYSVNDLPEKLVLRKCAKNIRAAAKIRLKSRSQIIKEIKIFLREGTSYRIYRLDISSFFESCNPAEILSQFPNHMISTQTQTLLRSFLSEFNKNYSHGIPRGIETSPILSELSLKEFDRAISKLEDVFYYTRFVDDVFIITSAQEDERTFLKSVRKTLPKGLILNHNKTVVVNIPGRSHGMAPPIADPVVASVEYLGYKISVVDYDLSKIYPSKPSSLKTIEYRRVDVDLTDKAVKRIEEKIFKAFYAYSKTVNYRLLKDRIVFLSSNRDLINKVKNRKIPTGIYYSHPEIDFPSESLLGIDRFLKVLISNPQGRIGSKIYGKLTKPQKKELLKINFSEGFRKRIFKRFSPNRLGEIARIW